MSRSIVRWPNPVLSSPCAPVAAFDAALGELLEELKRCIDHGFTRGAGLAAPQLGSAVQVAVVREPQIRAQYADEGMSLLLPNAQRRVKAAETPREHFLELVNPRFEALESPAFRELVTEGCLSVPGEFHKVARWNKGRCHYQTRTGEPRQFDCFGFFCQVLQHEVEHLQGIVYVDHLASMRREAIRQRLSEGP